MEISRRSVSNKNKFEVKKLKKNEYSLKKSEKSKKL